MYGNQLSSSEWELEAVNCYLEGLAGQVLSSGPVDQIIQGFQPTAQQRKILMDYADRVKHTEQVCQSQTSDSLQTRRGDIASYAGLGMAMGVGIEGIYGNFMVGLPMGGALGLGVGTVATLVGIVLNTRSIRRLRDAKLQDVKKRTLIEICEFVH
jgi:hypothetical protein